MLPKDRRLTRQQFWQVAQEGFKVHSSQFIVKHHPNNLGYSRWAIVTSTKLSKKAVVRNKLRRKIYNALRHETWDLGFDVIIFPRPAVLNLDDAKISNAVNQMVSKVSGLA